MCAQQFVTKKDSYGTMANSKDNWYPANGGKEEPFITRTGARLLYVWQPSTGKHAYLDTKSDLILTDEEAQTLLALLGGLFL